MHSYYSYPFLNQYIFNKSLLNIIFIVSRPYNFISYSMKNHTQSLTSRWVNLIEWWFRPTLLIHMGISLDSTNLREGHNVLAHNLAVGGSRVNASTSSWEYWRGVIEFQLVHISWSELNGIDFQAFEQATSLQDSGDIGTADITDITTRVQPAVLFNHTVQVGKGQVSLVGFFGKSGNIEASSVESLVQSFTVHGGSGVGVVYFEEGEHETEELRWEEWWVAVIGGIEPAPDVVVDTVWFSLILLEEGISSIAVEFGSIFRLQGNPSDLVALVLGPLDPGLVGVHLDTADWPFEIGV